MDWHGKIVCDPDIMMGKPTLAGTRLTVSFILDLFAQGWTQQQILTEYPHLTAEVLKAVFSYSSARLRDEDIVPFKIKA
jgi:uncharacterized protein (DUF433 family)